MPEQEQTYRTGDWVYFEVQEQPGLYKVWRGYHGWVTSTHENGSLYILRPGYQRSRLVDAEHVQPARIEPPEPEEGNEE